MALGPPGLSLALNLEPDLEPPNPVFGPSTAGRGASLELRDLSVAYGDRRVLSGVNLRVTAGELVAVIGTSGGGKTTLLRALAGLTPISDGQLQIGHHEAAPLASGRDPTEPAAPRVRVMFQEDRLLPWARVLENVTLGLPATQHGAARALLGAVGLADRAMDFPHTLSGGQRQRVALARALAHRPSLLLLDEPFGALDAITRGEMQGLVEQLWLESGVTVLLVTHDIDEALRLADRVILLRDGCIRDDLRVDLARPRRRSNLQLLEWRERLEAAL